ncbi:YdcF family protein [Fictibacillus nanhaiensis]|uniref:YdcF family protein n=1 Tax=Fictibacillus nanhaiensis TaxID=742169 RepID=UPI002E23AE71|nr:YdcF family protein [Fictibacillus nanhaiensis]
MNPIIPKEPIIPEFTESDVEFLTAITFEKELRPQKCDALFVFSGTHSGHWEKVIEAYNLNYVDKIIVTGGRSLTGIPHPDWDVNTDREVSEAQVIVSFLISAGIPSHIIFTEEKSTNSLENVICALEVFDFTKIQSLMVVCKSHATGRQIRTLKKHLPNQIEYIPFTFNTVYKGTEVNRNNWMETEIGRKRVWGEYLRINHYGSKGDILPLDVCLIV